MSQPKSFAPRRFALALFALILVPVSAASAQTLNHAMIESHIRAILAAYSAHDAEAVAGLDPASPGYGFRTSAARRADRPYVDTLKTFFASMDSYRIDLNEVQSAVDGDIAVAWGVWTEDFQQKGRAPETVRVRFSFTFKYDGSLWRTLFYHRDNQQFDAQGAYLRTP
jgi:ketosteroid isomerase-like protein